MFCEYLSWCFRPMCPNLFLLRPVVPGTRYHEEYVDGLTPHVAYTPECHGGIPWSGHCKSYNPWNIERYTTDLGGIRHFYRTSTWQNGLPGTFNNRQIQWSVRGAYCQNIHSTYIYEMD